MNTRLFSRRELLGTTVLGAAAMAALPALPARAYFEHQQSADCAVNHVQLSENLMKVLRDPDENEWEKNVARRTCSCLHCGVRIHPSDWLV
ncbi:MAG: hypothetical protein AAF441_26400 [Pseudomonadota bacterium]